MGCTIPTSSGPFALRRCICVEDCTESDTDATRLFERYGDCEVLCTLEGTLEGYARKHSIDAPMTTASFLIDVLFAGLIAAGLIPVINIVVRLVRENRLSGIEVEIPYEPSAVRTDRVSQKAQKHATMSPDIAHYVSSNGVIVTPNVEFAQQASDSHKAAHPHSEYWAYGDVAFYA